MKILDEIDGIYDSIQTDLNADVKVPKDVLDSFLLKNTLNPDIWDGAHLNPKVRNHLTKVALDFYRDLNLPKEAMIKDIIFTGSLANFNWSKFSDIDLHIVIDFNVFNSDSKFVQEYFNAQKSIWNQEHDITIHSFPVELYVQDINAKLVATAVYSVAKDKWLKKPTRETFKVDKKAIKSKADAIIDNLRDIRHDYQDNQFQSVVDKVTKLKKKIKQIRNAGLEKGGEFSIENLVFKTLRRTPFLDVLDSFKAKAYDMLMSISETKVLDETASNEPSQEDINKLFYTGEGFFDFYHAKEYARRFLGIDLVKQIGAGGNGAAYLTSKGTKLKFTYNENEFYFAKRSVGKQTDYMADYYSAQELIPGIYAIEMEYVNQLSPTAKEKLKQYFDNLIRNGELNQQIKAKVDYIKSKIGVWGNDLINYDNYGTKKGKLVTFDPVSEEILDENEVFDNTNFKYKRTEDGIDVLAYYDGVLIGNLHMSLVQGNGYDYFKDDFSEDEYHKMFPQDKFANIEWVQIKQKLYRGQGIAKELMKRAMAKANQQGYHKIYLNASPIDVGGGGLNLSDLTDFYKSLGFKEILHQGHNVQMLYSKAAQLDETREAMVLKKKKKDLETKLGKRLSDAEWNLFLQTGQVPQGKPMLQLDPEKAAELQRRQALLQARYAIIKAKRGY